MEIMSNKGNDNMHSTHKSLQQCFYALAHTCNSPAFQLFVRTDFRLRFRVPYAAISVWSLHLFGAHVCLFASVCINLYKRDELFPCGSINYSKYSLSSACFGQCWLFHRHRMVWPVLDSGQYLCRCVRITMENEDICSCLDLDYLEVAVVCARQITSFQFLLFLCFNRIANKTSLILETKSFKFPTVANSSEQHSKWLTKPNMLGQMCRSRAPATPFSCRLHSSCSRFSFQMGG